MKTPEILYISFFLTVLIFTFYGIKETMARPKEAERRSVRLEKSEGISVHPKISEGTSIRPEKPEETSVRPEKPEGTSECPEKPSETLVRPKKPERTSLRPEKSEGTSARPVKSEGISVHSGKPEGTSARPEKPEEISPDPKYSEESSTIGIDYSAIEDDETFDKMLDEFFKNFEEDTEEPEEIGDYTSPPELHVNTHILQIVPNGEVRRPVVPYSIVYSPCFEGTARDSAGKCREKISGSDSGSDDPEE